MVQVFRFEGYHDGRHGLAAAVLIRLEEHVVHDRQRHHGLLHDRTAGQLVTVHGAADGRVHLVRQRHRHHDAVIVGLRRRVFDLHGLDARGRRGRGRRDRLQ